ncbi:MAG: DUF4249 family protein [Bacteroidota bacterium]
MQNLFKFLLVFSVFIFIQCDPEEFFSTTIEVDVPEHESKLAVIAHLTTQDSAHRVFVSNSLGILEPPLYDEIIDATVELYEADDLIMSFGYNEDNRVYEVLNTGQLQAGKTYHLVREHSRWAWHFFVKSNGYLGIG